MNNIQKKQVGNRIKRIRKSRGENQTEFAKKINATLPAVSNWETGRNIPNNERLKIIADIANLSVAELLYGNNDFELDAEKYMLKKFNSYYKDNFGKIKIELNLLGGAIAESAGLKKSGEHIDKYNKHRDFFKNFKEYAINYIKNKYGNYSYKKFLNDYPDSDLIDFQKFKEEEWEKTKKDFDKIINNFKSEFKESNAVWINRHFTSYINDDLTSIKILASKENNKTDYLERFVQPILNDAADKIKAINQKLNKDGKDTK